MGPEGETNFVHQEFVILFSCPDKVCLRPGRRDVRVSGEHRAQDEQAGGAPGGGPQGELCVKSGLCQHSCQGEDIRGPGHLRQGAQLAAAGVRHQRHHREPQVRGVGAQRGAGAGDERDQGSGLALHLQLHLEHRGRVQVPGGQLLLPPRQPPPRQGQPTRPQQGRPAPPRHRRG